MKEHSIFTLWEEEAMHVRTVPNTRRAWRKRMPWEPLHLCIVFCWIALMAAVIKCHWVLWRHGYAIVITWFCKNEKRLLWSEVRFSALLSIPVRQTLLYFLAGVSPQLSNYSERVMECWSCLSTTTTQKKPEINLGCVHTCFDSNSLPLLPQVFSHSIFGFELWYS